MGRINKKYAFKQKQMSKPKEFAFTPKAYAKAMFHCCKHPQTLVVGTFVGKRINKVQQITDCIPLFHIHALEPFLGLAFGQIETYCTQHDLEICGIYYANASGSLAQLPANVKNIAEKVGSNVAQATLWVIDMLKMYDSDAPHHILRGTFASKDDVKSSIESVSVSMEAHDMTLKGIAAMDHIKLSDFDDHLNAGADWRNERLCQGSEWELLPLCDADKTTEQT